MTKPFGLVLRFKQGNGLVKIVQKQFGSAAQLAEWYEKCRPGRIEKDLEWQRNAGQKS